MEKFLHEHLTVFVVQLNEQIVQLLRCSKMAISIKLARHEACHEGLSEGWSTNKI